MFRSIPIGPFVREFPGGLFCASLLASTFLGFVHVSATEPLATHQDGSILYTGDNFSALFGSDGKLKSLRSGTDEFLSKEGCYLFIGGKKAGFGSAKIQGPHGLISEGAETKLEVSFANGSMHWVVENLTDQAFPLVIVLGNDVTAGRTTEGEYFKVPITQKILSNSVWYNSSACLEIPSSFNTGGPWGGWQILATYLHPYETCELDFAIRKISADEMTDVQNAQNPPKDAN